MYLRSLLLVLLTIFGISDIWNVVAGDRNIEDDIAMESEDDGRYHHGPSSNPQQYPPQYPPPYLPQRPTEELAQVKPPQHPQQYPAQKPPQYPSQQPPSLPQNPPQKPSQLLTQYPTQYPTQHPTQYPQYPPQKPPKYPSQKPPQYPQISSHPASPVAFIDQFDYRYPDGSYEFRYELADETVRYERGYLVSYQHKNILVVKGYYSYRLPDHRYLTVFYTADQYGYRQDSSEFSLQRPKLPRTLNVKVDSAVVLKGTGLDLPIRN